MGELLTPQQVLRRYKEGPKTGVFTDGSCEPNPGPGGWGFVWVENDRIVREAWGGDPDTTNNRMELTALIQAYRDDVGTQTKFRPYGPPTKEWLAWVAQQRQLAAVPK